MSTIARRHIVAALCTGLPMLLSTNIPASAQDGRRLTQAEKDALHPNDGFEPRGVCVGNALNLLYPFDHTSTTGWTQAMPPNDDGSTASISLGFTFQLYGTSYTSCFINNNGNITFGSSYSIYVPTGFPSSSVPPMIAPFWADVDTRNPSSGLVWYKIIDSDGDSFPDTLIVTWDNVGYYNQHVGLTDTFQVAISNGTNPVLGANIVCFSYDTMCWSTGDINGSGGFGGDNGPATVGINRGDGTNYFQIGRFGFNSAVYDGPFGATDGVHFLDGRRFCFNTGSTNVPPIPSNFPASGVVTVNAGQTLDLTVQFLSPEPGQTTTVSYNDFQNAVGKGLMITNTPGNVATVTLHWVTGCNDSGVYLLNFNAHDNFIPPGITNQNLIINVVKPVDGPDTLAITSPAPFACACSPVTITGSADDSLGRFKSYKVQYSDGAHPNGPYTLITSSTTPVDSGTLATWDTTGLSQGYYYVRLVGQNTCSPTDSVFTIVFVDEQFDDLVLRSPTNNQILGGTVCFDGTATDSCFSNYTVKYSPPPYSTFTPVDPANPTYNSAVINDPLASWSTNSGPTAVADGTYEVRLHGTDACGHAATIQRTVIIDNTPPVAVITSPTNCHFVEGIVPIIGTASDAHMAGWVVQYTGGSTHGWVTIASGSSNVVSGLLTNWNTAGLPRCAYTIRLIASDQASVNCGVTSNSTEYDVTLGVGACCDINRDGSRDGLDVQPFVTCILTNSGCP